MKCIFHMPLPLDKNSKSASGIRPQKMLQAFKDIGYEVFESTGYGKERKRSIQVVKKQIINGEKFDFLYSESSTMPTLLTEKHHYPTHPFLDFSFFKFCQKHNIKIGLFYRDIYWKFDDLYKKSLPKCKCFFAVKAYQYDLVKYGQLLSKLYVPSIRMYPYVQNNQLAPILDVLPPGCETFNLHSALDNSEKRDFKKNPLHIFYVGGLGNQYQIVDFLEAVKTTPLCEATICCRKIDWNKNKDILGVYSNCKNIQIIHENGKNLDKYYRKADICSLMFKPSRYIDFAIPYKAFEYLSWLKPVIVTRNTAIADFVIQNDIGWTIEYTARAIKKQLEQIIADPEMLRLKQENCSVALKKNLWTVRASKVIQDLSR